MFSFKKNGTIKIATDIDDYAAQILGIMEKKRILILLTQIFFKVKLTIK